jgi:hypothetical protein
LRVEEGRDGFARGRLERVATGRDRMVEDADGVEKKDGLRKGKVVSEVEE